MSAIFNLLANILITGTSIIGVATIVNKIGKFCKIIDENKKDGFKIGFDTIMLETINDMNNCVEAISNISNSSTKIMCIVYDIFIGNKYIKKDKDGKIIICSKSKIYSGFKDKIEELNNRVKKYKDELNKLKKVKDEDNEKLNENTYSEVSSDEDNNNEEILSTSTDDEISVESKNIKKDEFFLET